MKNRKSAVKMQDKSQRRKVPKRFRDLRVLFFFCSVLCGLFFFTHTIYAADHMTIVIDPGHGGYGNTDERETGASYNGLSEKDLNLLTAKSLKAELEQYGNVKVYMTREDDRKITIKERIEFAESVGADLVVSLHYNATLTHEFYGTEVWVSAFDRFYATGKGVGTCILEKLTDYGMINTGIKTKIGKAGTDYYGMIRIGRAAGIPTIILEHGHLDNETDVQKLDSAEEQQQLGIQDAAGIATYYGLEKGITKEEIIPTVMVEIPKEIVIPDMTEPASAKIKLLEYLPEENSIKCEISAQEPESRLMHYAYTLDGGVTFSPLFLWGEEETAEVVIPLPEGFTGTVLAKAFNNYQKGRISNNGIYMDTIVLQKEYEQQKREIRIAAATKAFAVESEIGPQDIEQYLSKKQSGGSGQIKDIGNVLWIILLGAVLIGIMIILKAAMVVRKREQVLKRRKRLAQRRKKIHEKEKALGIDKNRKVV